MPVTTSDFYSTVKNTSGSSLYFGYLGTLGKRLAANESYSEFGDLRSKLGAGNRVQARKSFENDCKSGDLTPLSFPVVVLRDETTSATKALVLNSGSLSAVDPHWGQSDSLGGGL